MKMLPLSLVALFMTSCSSIEPKPPTLLTAQPVPVRVPIPVACLATAQVPTPPDSRPPPEVVNGDQRIQTAWVDSLVRYLLIYADKADVRLRQCATDPSLAANPAKDP